MYCNDVSGCDNFQLKMQFFYIALILTKQHLTV